MEFMQILTMSQKQEMNCSNKTTENTCCPGKGKEKVNGKEKVKKEKEKKEEEKKKEEERKEKERKERKERKGGQ